jgi:hypothetical protein
MSLEDFLVINFATETRRIQRKDFNRKGHKGRKEFYDFFVFFAGLAVRKRNELWNLAFYS